MLYDDLMTLNNNVMMLYDDVHDVDMMMMHNNKRLYEMYDDVTY